MPAVLRGGDERDILAAKFEIEYEETFHLKNLYKRMYDWMVSEGWKSADGDDELYETLYWERTSTGDFKEHNIWWRAYLVPGQNTYYRYFIKIDMMTLAMKKHEVMSKGQKFGTNRGDIIIMVESYLQLDYKNQWEKAPIAKMFEKWFRRRLYLENIEKYKRDLYMTTYRLHTTIKQYLELKPTTADWGRPFHPEKGV